MINSAHECAALSVVRCGTPAGDLGSLVVVLFLFITPSGGCWSTDADESIELLIASQGEGKIPDVSKRYNARAYQEKLTTVRTTEDGSSVYVAMMDDANGMNVLDLRVGQEVNGVVRVTIHTDVSLKFECEPPTSEAVLVEREFRKGLGPDLQLGPGMHNVEITFPSDD